MTNGTNASVDLLLLTLRIATAAAEIGFHCSTTATPLPRTVRRSYDESTSTQQSTVQSLPSLVGLCRRGELTKRVAMMMVVVAVVDVHAHQTTTTTVRCTNLGHDCFRTVFGGNVANVDCVVVVVVVTGIVGDHTPTTNF